MQVLYHYKRDFYFFMNMHVWIHLMLLVIPAEETRAEHIQSSGLSQGEATKSVIQENWT